MKRLLPGLLIAALLGLFLVSCDKGGEVGDAGTPPPPPSAMPAGQIAADSGVTAFQPRQIKDPVDLKPIDASIYWDHPSGRVYFSSAENRDAFSEDPDKYTKNLDPGVQQ